ncbi:unnamed protein product [Adineta ricciae]|uniref:Uncharacterized protein n=1 Tax=Adineta ricciae TaxID=249248 RepID=A0A815NBU3_ADIRI|nr:unnamed protein product [Adineta ricciae]CAF1435176.1 unnamed protein product [Adineta ricciae]
MLLLSRMNTLTITKPTQQQYEKLKLKYPISLKCLCKEISIPYKQLINIQVEYYEICLSDFTKQKWIDYLFNEKLKYYHPFDFRRVAPFKFQLLRTLCQQSKRFIDDNLEEFYSNHLISKEPMSVDEFHIQVNFFIKSFQQTTRYLLENLVTLIEDTMCVNFLLTAVDTHFIYKTRVEFVYMGSENICYYNTKEKKVKHSSCTCRNKEHTKHPEDIYGAIEWFEYHSCRALEDGLYDSNKYPGVQIPGMIGCCLPIESLRYSTLECFYEQSCLDIIGLYTTHPSISTSDFSILKHDSSAKSITIEELIKKSFVKQWFNITSYEKYFSYCQPLSCQYTAGQGKSLFYIFTTTISLFGGLKLILPVIVLYVVAHIREEEQQQRLTDNTDANQLQCPCTQISLKYSEFIQFRPTYHQICSSIFVSPNWNQWGANWKKQGPCASSDFINQAHNYFYLLSAYCQLSQDIVLKELEHFYVMQYTTSGVIQFKQFDSEVKSVIENFKVKTQKSPKTQLNIIQSVIFNNQFLSHLRIGMSHRIQCCNTTTTVKHLPMNYDNCSCATDSTCHKTNFFCRETIYTSIPNIYSGCYFIDSLLLSQTSCFYDEKCLDIIRRYMDPNTILYGQIFPLDISKKTRYKTNVTIGILLDNLFIEEWNDFYSYDKYYSTCQPSFCSYEIQERRNSISILTEIIGIYSGLTIIIRFLIPNLVRLIRRRKRHVQVTATFGRLNFLFQLCKTKLLKLNLFRNRSTDYHTVRKQIISTRSYLITFILTLSLCILYTSLTNKFITVKFQLKDLKQYEQLYNKYPNTLTCLCNEISIKYEEFIQLTPIYHEICSSDFIQQKWIDYLLVEENVNDRNFQATGSFQFQAVRSLCRLIEETVDLSLTQLYSTMFVSNQLISRDSFQNRIDNTVDLFIKSTEQRFKHIFQITREIFHGSAVLTTHQTNWEYDVLLNKLNQYVFYTKAITYNNMSCTCATSLHCVEAAKLNGISINGLFTGCYPVESMLLSSFECLYNKTCVDFILSNIAQKLPMIEVKVLQLRTKFGINETVQHMVDRLFVNEWNPNYSYLNYSKKCRSTDCTYSFIQKFNALYTIISILNLYGCVTILLSFLIPSFIEIIFRIYNRKTQMTIVPAVPVQN